LIVITRRDRRLAAGVIWGPGLFILAWVVGGFMIDGYSPIVTTSAAWPG
jgi:hypothetical protein